MELTDAATLATELLEEHGLEHWTIMFDSAKKRAGVCRFGPRVIGLSGPLTRLHTPEEVRQTVLHEIAHALVGPEHGHDAVWQAQARAIGGDARRCLPPDAPAVPAPWVGVCPAGHRSSRHRRPERVVSCVRCSPTFSIEHVLEWTFRGGPAALHPNYVAELDRMRNGGRLRMARVGDRVRITVRGDFHGRTGTVVKVGRTSYHVQLPGWRVRVVFAGAEPFSPSRV